MEGYRKLKTRALKKTSPQVVFFPLNFISYISLFSDGSKDDQHQI